MTTLAQGAMNSVAQFVMILLKILILHLCDRVKFFPNDVKIKRPKTTYNIKRFVFEIKQYVVEHINNLYKVLANLQ